MLREKATLKLKVDPILFMSRCPLYDKDFPIILSWSQKSGCSSLTKWFFFQLGLLEEAMEYQPTFHHYRSKVFMDSDRVSQLRKEIMMKSKPVFKLVRNPYSRAVSSYLHLVHYHENEMFMDPWQVIYKRNDGLSFKQYLYVLKAIGPEIENLNGHLAQQYIDGEERWVDQLIKLEQFNTSIRDIERKFHLKESPLKLLTNSLAHKSTLVGSGPSTGNFAERIFRKEDLIKGNLPIYNSFYDQETVKLCREIFKKDFKAYGY